MFKRDITIEKINKIKKIALIFTIISTLLLTIAYASVSNTLSVENIMATVTPIGSARITNVMVSNITNGGLSNSEGYNYSSIYGSMNLPNSDSTITYKVNATVFLTSEMKIVGITGLNSKLEYELTDYTLGNPLCNNNDECNYGATKEFYITIKYKQGEYDSTNTNYPLNLTFDFQEVSYIARIGNTRYETLQEAVDSVPRDNTETTILLLKNTSEIVTILSNKNIVLNLQGNTISNNGEGAVITTHGRLVMSNGTITSNAAFSAVDVETTGTFIITGGRIIATGLRQTIYNKGNVTISGNPYLSATTNIRATVQNTATGTMNITGGTIISSSYYGVDNAGVLNIGVKDGTVDKTTPVIQASSYAVNSNKNYGFYDGILKSTKSSTINKETYMYDIEDTYEKIKRSEVINGMTYNTLHLGRLVTVTFDPNEGTLSETERRVEINTSVGTLPSPTRTNCEFDGWYTEGGRKINASEVIDTATTFYAHWIHIDNLVTAEVNGTTYNTLQKAVNAVPKNGTLTTINLQRSTSEQITISSGQNIVLNLQNNTVNNKGNTPVFTNNGTLTVNGGYIKSSATQGAINNEATGILTINNTTIEATGTKQALYNNGGNATITGTSVLSATSNSRAAVQNLSNGTITILNGTIVSTSFNAIENAATLNIGTKDGNINNANPLIKSSQYGINTTGTLNFYDGVAKGKVGSINGTVSDIEIDSTRIDLNEVIDGDTYHITYLQ